MLFYITDVERLFSEGKLDGVTIQEVRVSLLHISEQVNGTKRTANTT
jgi:hypothetical protein